MTSADAHIISAGICAAFKNVKRFGLRRFALPMAPWTGGGGGRMKIDSLRREVVRRALFDAVIGSRFSLSTFKCTVSKRRLATPPSPPPSRGNGGRGEGEAAPGASRGSPRKQLRLLGLIRMGKFASGAVRTRLSILSSAEVSEPFACCKYEVYTRSFGDPSSKHAHQLIHPLLHLF